MEKTENTFSAAAIGAALTPVIVWIWNDVVPGMPPMPAEVSGSLGVIIGTMVYWIVSWVKSK